MKKEAEINAETDKKAHELADARNAADQTVYAAEKALTDHGASIPEDVKGGVQRAIDALKTARGTGDTDGIKNANAGAFKRNDENRTVHESEQFTGDRDRGQGGEQSLPKAKELDRDQLRTCRERGAQGTGVQETVIR